MCMCMCLEDAAHLHHGALNGVRQPQHSHGRVLLVEDEAAVRLLLQLRDGGALLADEQSELLVAHRHRVRDDRAVALQEGARRVDRLLRAQEPHAGGLLARHVRGHRVAGAHPLAPHGCRQHLGHLLGHSDSPLDHALERELQQLRRLVQQLHRPRRVLPLVHLPHLLLDLRAPRAQLLHLLLPYVERLLLVLHQLDLLQVDLLLLDSQGRVLHLRLLGTDVLLERGRRLLPARWLPLQFVRALIVDMDQLGFELENLDLCVFALDLPILAHATTAGSSVGAEGEWHTHRRHRGSPDLRGVRFVGGGLVVFFLK